MKSVVCVEKSVENLGSPSSSWSRQGAKKASIRDTDNEPRTGNPETEVCWTLSS